jgi:trk system potassium uptake protein TrkA
LKVVIAGAGEVGFNLIENLSRENNKILAIDTDEQVLQRLSEVNNVATVRHNITDTHLFSESFLKDVDLFFAITNSDETNLIASQMAKEAGVKKTICRAMKISVPVEKTDFSLEALGVDHIINPIEVVANELYRLIEAPNSVHSHDFFKGKITLIGFHIKEHARIIGKKIGYLNRELSSRKFHIVTFQREGRTILPGPDDVVKKNDIINFICPSDGIRELRRELGYNRTKKRRVFINGSGRVGFALARKLEDSDVKLKIICRKKQNCFHSSDELSKGIVLHMDGTDTKGLVAEGINGADYFLSVTNDDHVNMVSCMLAGEAGVKYTISLVKQPEYVSMLANHPDVYLAISPRSVTARYLSRYIHGDQVTSYSSIPGSQLEVLEIKINKGSSCLNVSMKQLKLPEGVRIILIKRKENWLFPEEGDVLKPEDQLIVILHKMDRGEVLRFFQQPADEIKEQEQ